MDDLFNLVEYGHQREVETRLYSRSLLLISAGKIIANSSLQQTLTNESQKKRVASFWREYCIDLLSYVIGNVARKIKVNVSFLQASKQIPILRVQPIAYRALVADPNRGQRHSSENGGVAAGRHRATCASESRISRGR
jgi:hypothetical protein